MTTEPTGPTRTALVVIPTYNERENIEPIVGRVRASAPAAHILIVDDGSPDGTGDIADRLSAADTSVHVLHRTAKAGLGAAYIAGFGWALAQEHPRFELLIEMDADGSHAPEHLPALIAKAEHADVVVGSRWVRGGQVVNWPKRREALSRGANLYTRLALGIGVRDSTAGFRAYRREVLEAIPLGSVDSQGYCFQVDMTWRAAQQGFVIAEVPITFLEREHGESKMSGSIVREAYVKVTKWGLARRRSQVADLARRALRR
ncbi:MAG: dolichyl-phosphate beta-D-mannosyltransferase [Pseudonocardiales bacterium]|nr:dolichyl-phosphate beta-D-mannosyltransferase [Pseudonocardiales bacterium]